MNPLKSSIQKGIVSVGDNLLLLKLRKVNRKDFYYLMIEEFKVCKDQVQFKDDMNWMNLSNYFPHQMPLGKPSKIRVSGRKLSFKVAGVNLKT